MLHSGLRLFTFFVLASLCASQLGPIMTINEMARQWTAGRSGYRSHGTAEEGGDEAARIRLRSVSADGSEEYVPRTGYPVNDDAQYPGGYNATVTLAHPDAPDYWGYLRYDAMNYFMDDAATRVPGSSVLALGRTVEGREIRCWHNPGPSGRAGFPRLFLGAGLDGNAAAPRQAAVHTMNLLARAYQKNDAWARSLLDGAELTVCPALNPDGFELGNSSNANDVLLHRNFEDRRLGAPALAPEQPETRALRELWESRPPSASLILYGGVWGMLYPWNAGEAGAAGVYETSPKDRLLYDIARSSVKQENVLRASPFKDGVSNGAEYLYRTHSPSDWLLWKLDAAAMSFEAGPSWPSYYDMMAGQIDATITVVTDWMKRSTISFGGRVIDATTNRPIAGAVVRLRGDSQSVEEALTARTDPKGNWNTPVYPSDVRYVTISAPGYEARPAYTQRAEDADRAPVVALRPVSA